MSLHIAERYSFKRVCRLAGVQRFVQHTLDARAKNRISYPSTCMACIVRAFSY